MKTVGAHFAGAAGRSHPPWVLAGEAEIRSFAGRRRLRGARGTDQLQCGIGESCMQLSLISSRHCMRCRVL